MRVHKDFPLLDLRRALEPDRPHEAMAVAGSDRSGVRLAILELGRRVGDHFQGRALEEHVFRLTAVRECEPRGERVGGGQPGRRVDAHVAPGLGAREDEVPVADDGHELPVADGHPAEDLRDSDMPEIGVRGACPRLPGARRVDPEDRAASTREPENELAHGALVDLLHRAPQNGRHLVERDLVAVARPGDERQDPDQARRCARPGVDEGRRRALRGSAAEERLPRVAVRKVNEHVAHRYVRAADVEVRLKELLLGESGVSGSLGTTASLVEADSASRPRTQATRRRAGSMWSIGVSRLGDGGWGRRKVHTREAVSTDCVQPSRR